MVTQSSFPNRHEAWLAGRSDSHFAWVVNDPDELESPLSDALRGSLAPDEAYRLIIQSPYQGVLAARDAKRTKGRRTLHWELTPDWLLALTHSRLLLVGLAENANSPQMISIPLENIFSLQNGTVLLFSWFEVCWAENGTSRRQKVYFNAVCEPFFARLAALVRASWPAVGEDGCTACSLDELPFKFRNLLPQRVLLPGEQAQRVLFRPSMWQTRHILFRRMTAPRMTLALTHACLTLAEEDLAGRDGSYGFIVTWVPRTAIQRMECTEEEGKAELRVSLARQGATLDLRAVFPPRFAKALQEWVE